jgi:hypothetical protein
MRISAFRTYAGDPLSRRTEYSTKNKVTIAPIVIPAVLLAGMTSWASNDYLSSDLS